MSISKNLTRMKILLDPIVLQVVHENLARFWIEMFDGLSPYIKHLDIYPIQTIEKITLDDHTVYVVFYSRDEEIHLVITDDECFIMKNGLKYFNITIKRGYLDDHA